MTNRFLETVTLPGNDRSRFAGPSGGTSCMRRKRNVKIVATVGPASSSREMLLKLFRAGVDVFRLNMSHGTHAEITERHAAIREIEAEAGRPIGILADLQGPKLRVGQFADGPVELAPGQTFRFDLDEAPGGPVRVQLPHPEIFAALKPVSPPHNVTTRYGRPKRCRITSALATSFSSSA